MYHMDRLEQAYQAYHSKNPQVFTYLENLVRELRNAGITKTGMSLLFGRLRWDMALSTNKTDDFKINENLSCLYARELIKTHPEWEGMFEIRARRTKEAA